MFLKNNEMKRNHFQVENRGNGIVQSEKRTRMGVLSWRCNLCKDDSERSDWTFIKWSSTVGTWITVIHLSNEEQMKQTAINFRVIKELI